VDEPEPMDFSWFYLIGSTKFNLSIKEVGRLTLRMFGRFYTHYKNDFDLELKLWKSNTTYADAHKQQQQDEEWF